MPDQPRLAALRRDLLAQDAPQLRQLLSNMVGAVMLTDGGGGVLRAKTDTELAAPLTPENLIELCRKAAPSMLAGAPATESRTGLIPKPDRLVERFDAPEGVVDIVYDEDPANPRDDDNQCRFYCIHKRYTLGDKHDHRSEDFSGWGDMEERLREEHPGKKTLVVPLYMIDHSGLAISTAPFGCPWDSGQIGFVVLSQKAIELEDIKDPAAAVEAEVAEYNAYLRGDVYGWIRYDAYGETDESCWGYRGDGGLKCIKEELGLCPGPSA